MSLPLWYEPELKDRYRTIFDTVKGIEQQQSDVHESNICWARLYANREEPGLRTGSRAKWRDGWQGVTENIIQQAIDTATSLIAKSRPKVTVLTDGADWDMQQLAKRLDKYLWGMFQSLRVHQLMTDVFRDACIFGTGCLKIIEKDSDICVERVLVDEIVVDEAEIPAGELPRSVHQVKLVSKEVLKSLYPDKEAVVEKSGMGDRAIWQWRHIEPDMVLVIESWHLEPNGIHTICVSEGELFSEEYRRDWLPFVFYRWTRPITGFYGQGIAERLLGFQVRLNDMNDFIERCQDLIAVPTVAIDAASQVRQAQLTDDIGRVIPYVGQPPKWFTPTALNPEYYQYKERLAQRALEEIGLNQMTTHGTKPQGIEAAVALRELSDNQSQRFSIQQQFFEDAHLELGWKMLMAARDIYKDRGKVPSVFLSEKFVETIDWPKADFDLNRFTLQVQASSILSNTPAGRLQQVIELSQYGVPLSPAEIRKLLAHPDLEQSDRYATSTLDDIEWVIGKLADGEQVVPEPFQDLTLGLELVTAAYLDARRLGAPEDILQNYRDWIQLAQKEVEAAMPPPAPPMREAPMPMEPAMAPPPMM